jgi:hypothetical protein
MKTLPKQFEKKGFTYKQVKRIGDKAIFEQTKKGQEGITYEVVKINRHNGYELGGQKIPPGEAYPSTSQWGVAGWTYQNIRDAEVKFKKLK